MAKRLLVPLPPSEAVNGMAFPLYGLSADLGINCHDSVSFTPGCLKDAVLCLGIPCGADDRQGKEAITR